MPIPRFTFFAVEKGNMTLAQFDNGINMLIDVHLASCRPSPLAYLQDRIEKLDILVVTHPHQDHLTGLSDVCEYYKPKHLWHCGRYFKPEPVFDDWSYYEQLRSGKFSYCSPTSMRSGMTVLIGSSEIRVVAPVLPFLDGTPEDVNNNGMILSIVSGNSKVVITGDTQEEQWDTVDLSRLANASVFLASHHGRKNGFSERVLKAIKPQAIIISDGEICDTDATREYEKFARVSTTREHNITVSATASQPVAV